MNKILLIDNNDSFTYNLVQILEENECEVKTVNNHDALLEDISKYSGIVISPGPGNPSDYKNLFEFLKLNYSKNKFLGVCLGHQVIGEFFGAKNYQLNSVFHGIQSNILISADSGLYRGIKSEEMQVIVGRYHSWSLSKNNFPEDLQITAEDAAGIIMSFEHKHLPIFGVQYHPESYITVTGEKILQNWLKI